MISLSGTSSGERFRGMFSTARLLGIAWYMDEGERRLRLVLIHGRIQAWSL